MTTELALAWESDEKLRKKARLHALAFWWHSIAFVF